jgi:hypothetical protein
MKLNSLLILLLIWTTSFSQELTEGTYDLNNQSLIIHKNDRFEIYDYRWADGLEVPFGTGKYTFSGDSLILNFDDIDTSELLLSMNNYINIIKYKNKEGDEKKWAFVLQILNNYTNHPIPGIVITTEIDTLLTDQYGQILLNTDSLKIHLKVFHPYWSIATEDLILDVSEANKIEIRLTPPEWIPYRCKELKFKIVKYEEDNYKLFQGFHLYSEMKLQNTP